MAQTDAAAPRRPTTLRGAWRSSRWSWLHDALGARGMPVTAFYDASGRLRTVVTGAIGADDLRARLRALFGATA